MNTTLQIAVSGTGLMQFKCRQLPVHYQLQILPHRALDGTVYLNASELQFSQCTAADSTDNHNVNRLATQRSQRLALTVLVFVVRIFPHFDRIIFRVDHYKSDSRTEMTINLAV
jgi:hypothetical protein